MSSMVNISNDLDSDSSEEMDTWISQYCSMFGHDYFVEVVTEFIEDDFNLTGLSSIVPHYKEALDVILDLEPEIPIKSTNIPLIEHAAELLYGLIHARYILTKQGLHSMAEKFEDNCFGSCPRYYCEGMHLIPIGRYDQPGVETVRLYCPNCNDIYLPSSSRYLNIDGAFFGTSFAGLFIKMFPEIERQCNERSKLQFNLKLFGFKLNENANCGPRMKWLRKFPKSSEELEEFKNCEFGFPNLKNIKDSNNNNSKNNNSNDDDEDVILDTEGNMEDEDDIEEEEVEEGRASIKQNDEEDEEEEEEEEVDNDVRMSGGESMMSIAKD